MSQSSDRSDKLTMLCAQLPVLRRLNRGPVGAQTRELLEQAVAVAREGRPIDGYLEALGLALAPAPEVAISEDGAPWPSWEPPRDAGHTRVPRVPQFFDGVYVCPQGACGRAERRQPGADLPECAIFGEALRFDGDS